MITGVVKYLSYLFIFCMGFCWFKRRRSKVDYKKYLGPDWKPDYTSAGLSISNHQTGVDILIRMMSDPCPGFVAKKQIADMPGFGVIATSIQCLYLSRGAGPEARKKTLEEIRVR